MDKEQSNERLIEIGRRIRQVREKSELSLHQLALLSGISASALSLIETGKRNLRIITLNQIAFALRVPVSDLLGNREKGIQANEMGKGEGYDLGDYE